jgi:hypothetical protein
MHEFSRHAAKRSKERSLPPAIIDWLHDFGTSYPAGDGAEKLIFDKPARRRLERNLGPIIYRKIEVSLDAFAVRSAEGGIITCGWMTSKVRR